MASIIQSGEEDPSNMFDELMSRGEKLRQLRLLAQADEEERQRNDNHKLQRSQRQLHKKEQNGKIIITNESMAILHENNTKKEQKLPLSSSHHLTYSTLCSSSENSFIGDEQTMLFLPQQEVQQGCENDICISDDEKVNHYSQELNDNEEDNEEEDEVADVIDILPDSKMRILRYDSYLSHQRYNDDYKHADCHFVDFGYVAKDVIIGNTSSSTFLETNIDNDDQNRVMSRSSRLIIEQNKSLGKGGLVWDAGVILADHLIATQKQWRALVDDESSSYRCCSLMELGAGTGVTGLMIAKAVSNMHVYITDLPDVMRLMERNLERNFCTDSINHVTITDKELMMMDRGDATHEMPAPKLKELSGLSTKQLSSADFCSMYYEVPNDGHEAKVDFSSFKESNNHVTAKVLRWGMKEDYTDGPFDVIIAGDVITSLYDPTALAQTIYDLCHEKSMVFICFKRRLSKYHDMFDDIMSSLFESIDFLSPVTRHKNLDNICIMRATERRPNTALQ